MGKGFNLVGDHGDTTLIPRPFCPDGEGVMPTSPQAACQSPRRKLNDPAGSQLTLANRPIYTYLYTGPVHFSLDAVSGGRKGLAMSYTRRYLRYARVACALLLVWAWVGTGH